jgi:hypothetical protein
MTYYVRSDVRTRNMNMNKIKIAKSRLTKLKSLVIKHGEHADFEKGVCAMEAVAWLAKEPHSDHPACTCAVIAAFVRSFNDRLRTDEERSTLLRPLLPDLVGTAGSRELRIKRGYLAADWAVRIMLPILLRALEWEQEAAACEGIPAIVDPASAARGQEVAQHTRAAANAAAAYTAAYTANAAADAVYAADAYAAAAAADAYAYAAAADAADALVDVYAAAAYAADAAAADAVYAADAYAAYAAAAPPARLTSARDAINASAVDLIKRMVETTDHGPSRVRDS